MCESNGQLTSRHMVAVEDHVKHVAPNLDELVLVQSLLLLSGLPCFENLLMKEVGSKRRNNLQKE